MLGFRGLWNKAAWLSLLRTFDAAGADKTCLGFMGLFCLPKMSRDSEHDFASSKYSEHTSTRSFVDDDEKEPEVSPRKNNHLKAIEKIREDHKNLREQDWAIASRASERDALWLSAPPGISTRDIHEMWSDHVRYHASRAWPLDTKPFFHRRARRLVIVFYADRGLFPVRQGLRRQFDRILLDFAHDRLCYKDFQDRDQPVLHYYDEYLRSRNSEKPGYAHWAKKSAEVSRSYLKPGLIKGSRRSCSALV